MKKKNDIYDPEKLSLKVNPFAEAFNEIIVDATDSFDDTSDSNFIVSNKKFIHNLNDRQVEFFEKLYIPFRRSENFKKLILPEIKLSFPDMETEKVGENEWEIIKYSTSKIIDKLRILPIVAPIGQGKTSLISYTLIYLRYISKSFREKTIPLIIDCHTEAINLEKRKTEKGLYNYLKELLNIKLRNILSPFTRLNNNNFWDWYLEVSETTYQDDYEDIVDSFVGERLINEINLLRRNEKRKSHYVFTAIKYIIEIEKKSIIIVFDNLDPLDIHTIAKLIWSGKRIINLAKIKILYTIRSSTLEKLDKKTKGILPPFRIDWSNVDYIEIIKKRCSFITEKALVKANRISFTLNDGLRLKTTDIRKVLENFFMMIINNSDIVVLFSSRNIRLMLRLLRVVIRSPYLPEWVYGSVFFPDIIKGEEKPIPYYIMIHALVANRFSTFVEKQREEVPGLINIMTADTNDPKTNFLYILILSYLNKNFNYDPAPLQSVIKDLEYLFEDNKYHLNSVICSKIANLINAGLITSPETYKVENSKSIIDLEEISITPLGNYYISRLLFDFNYIMFVKDEVQLNGINFSGTAAIRKKSTELNNFIYWKFIRLNLFDIKLFFAEFSKIEREFLNYLIVNERLWHFNNKYNITSNKFYTLKMIEDTINKFSGSEENKDIIDELLECKLKAINKLIDMELYYE